MDGKLLAAQLEGNQDELAKDMRTGLTELLNLHNAEELRVLCETLQVESYFEKSKKSNIEYILSHIVGLADPDKSSSDVDVAYSKVLRAVWDGIVIEYLRSLGKNLVRCRDNLRGEVLAHWRRNAVRKVQMNAEDGQTVFMKHSAPWTRTAEEATTETDERVLEFLDQLKAAEDILKIAERSVHVHSDFNSVVAFLSQVGKVRTIEENCRVMLLRDMSKVLEHHDVLSKNIRALEESLCLSQNELKHNVLMQTTKQKFRSSTDHINQVHAVDLIHTRVHVAKLQTLLAEERAVRDQDNENSNISIQQLQKQVQNLTRQLSDTNELLVESRTEATGLKHDVELVCKSLTHCENNVEDLDEQVKELESERATICAKYASKEVVNALLLDAALHSTAILAAPIQAAQAEAEDLKELERLEAEEALGGTAGKLRGKKGKDGARPRSATSKKGGRGKSAKNISLSKTKSSSSIKSKKGLAKKKSSSSLKSKKGATSSTLKKAKSNSSIKSKKGGTAKTIPKKKNVKVSAAETDVDGVGKEKVTKKKKAKKVKT